PLPGEALRHFGRRARLRLEGGDAILDALVVDAGDLVRVGGRGHPHRERNGLRPGHQYLPGSRRPAPGRVNARLPRRLYPARAGGRASPTIYDGVTVS